MPRDVTDYLRGPEVDLSEMIWQMPPAYHQRREEDNTITFFRSGQPKGEENFALRLTIKNGHITKVIQGPALSDEDLEQIHNKIEQNLLQLTGDHFHRGVLFSSTPIQGSWRYKDKFQILPPPPESPMPGPGHDFGFARYPFVLELKYSGSANFKINMMRGTKTTEELSYLFSSLLEGSIYGLGQRPRSHWVLLPERRSFWQRLFAKTRRWDVGFCNEFYTLGDMGKIHKFSSNDHLPPLPFEESKKYYLERCDSLNSDGLKLPENFEESLDRFFSLPIEKRESYLRAGYYFQRSSMIFDYSSSISYIALIQAVEAIMPSISSSEVCETCKSTLRKGPTSLFAEFLESLLGNSSDAHRHLKVFYSVRSALSHGGKILHLDRVGGGGVLSMGELARFINLRRIVRLALVKWLYE
ncbi:hypothetical protein [Candidatus Manganitrophus noduliformans]|uniref:Apea-like HEPN domain-containing protein n=1 Tax=Candidatus Manganitrophus noduliformans TaxID=2606439 RepID=A0A7X6DT01_9BACT|nr:hypothetical protein [Candidatus Manganitrophus noduliformans]NKE72827.1 hypothetical protein [Candidatus Manganitrophus noduliformans]